MNLGSYERTGDLILDIRNKAIEKLREKSATEANIARLILSEYKKNGLKVDGKPAVIVSFGKNTGEIHHNPGKSPLKSGPIMLDMFAISRKSGKQCYADMTFMAYKGSPSKEFMKIFKIYVKSRNLGMYFLKKCLKKHYMPSYFELDSITRSYLTKKFLGFAFQHRIGHSMGKKVHAGGKAEYYEKLKFNQPYTFEPGIYFPGKFGIRLENDFWIDKNFKLHVKGLQNKLILV